MDDKWFKHRQKIADVTAEDIGAALGRDRSVVSRIYTGRQKMTWGQAQIFAKVLSVPLKDVLEHAGLASDEPAPSMPGFGEAEVAPFAGKGARLEKAEAIAARMGGGRNGIDIWTVHSDALGLLGYLPGDTILVDSTQPGACSKGDTVIAQIYDWQIGAAETVLRRYEPPVLLGLSGGAVQTHVVDDRNVAIKGRIIAAWREM